MPDIKLTIITVCFNAESTIRRCIQSIGVNENVQYIVIDGASVDGTMEILKEYIDTIDVLVSEKDNGIYDAMNKGLSFAEGKFVTFLNADDSYTANGLESMLTALSSSPEDVDVFYGDWIGVDSHGIKKLRNANHILKSKYSLCHQAIAAKRSIFIDTAGFNTKYKYCADFDLISLWVASGKIFKKISNCIVEFSECGASANYYYYSAREAITIALHRHKSPWALAFILRTILFTIRTFLIKYKKSYFKI
jgi:glycosyltransferase involved in cell wall biosynthesis